MMRAGDVRQWLGLYMLVATIVFGAYLIVLPDTVFLPIRRADSLNAFKILIPSLVTQLSIVFAWYSEESVPKSGRINIPVWVVKGPPLLLALTLLVGLAAGVVANRGSRAPEQNFGETFTYLVTFCVSVLNATTFVVLKKYFALSK